MLDADMRILFHDHGPQLSHVSQSMVEQIKSDIGIDETLSVAVEASPHSPKTFVPNTLNPDRLRLQATSTTNRSPTLISAAQLGTYVCLSRCVLHVHYDAPFKTNISVASIRQSAQNLVQRTRLQLPPSKTRSPAGPSKVLDGSQLSHQC